MDTLCPRPALPAGIGGEITGAKERKKLSHSPSETYVLFRRLGGSLVWRRGGLTAGLDCVVSSDGAHAIIISNGALTYKRNGEFHFDDQGN